MSEQDGRQKVVQQRPTTNDQDEWKAYWKTQEQPWRTEPEIDTERQKYLTERRAIKPDIKQGIYPFKDVKLSRADVEWLLATHESEGIRGPVDWSVESQRKRDGLDLRGADLSSLDLSGLPLARMNAGGFYWSYATIEQHKAALAHFEGASLFSAHLEGAFLRYAHLENADLSETHLENAKLRSAHLERAWLSNAHLERANLRFAHLEGAYLGNAHLEGANLGRAFFDQATQLYSIDIGSKELGIASLVDVHWGNVNLAVVKWSQVNMLGDEKEARQRNTSDGKAKSRTKRLEEYQIAIRANRQLAVVLRDQGLNEEADHFAYRAQVLHRKEHWLQHDFGRWLFLMLLALLSGYGYRIWRILAAYIVMVSLFALAYFVLGLHYSPHLHLDQAYLESITAFHGRVFLEQFSISTPQIWLTALEAIAGLIIEGVFIAMLIQRFFGK